MAFEGIARVEARTTSASSPTAKRSAKDDQSITKKLREFFGDDRKLAEIGVEDADGYVDEHDDLSPKTLANHITLLITMMNNVGIALPRRIRK